MAGRGAVLVAAGIALSRVAGFVRESVFAHFFGNSLAADAFKAAIRIPNLLQNLLGEGVLSASFIPVYAQLRAKGDEEAAERVAGAVFTLLLCAATVISALGVIFSPQLIDLITPGFEGERRELAISLTRVFFPGSALFVLSAWCLGVLNSHRRFFLSYVAPVAWNVTVIASLVVFGASMSGPRLAWWVAWGVTAGALVQVLVQVPTSLRLLGRLRLDFGRGFAPLREVVRNFLPVVMGRGVVQVSAFVDSMVASLLPGGAVASLAYAQTMYLLPVSLFGMSVSAAELPEMSSVSKGEGRNAALRARLQGGLRQIAFFVVPVTIVFIVLGDVVTAALYQSGRFTAEDTIIVWATLAAMSIGLPASTQGRLCASAFYAMKDTKTPLRFAMLRVTVATGLGLSFALYGPELLGVNPVYGVAGLALGSALSAWLEYALPLRAVSRKLEGVPTQGGQMLLISGAALSAAGAALLVHPLTAQLGRFVAAGTVLPVFGVVYLGLTLAAKVPEAERLVARCLRK